MFGSLGNSRTVLFLFAGMESAPPPPPMGEGFEEKEREEPGFQFTNVRNHVNILLCFPLLL